MVDVLAGRQVHHGVRAPQRGPAQLFHLLLDRGGDRAVPDVGVDLHLEAAADDHRLDLGMVDVGGKNGAPARDLAPGEIGVHPLAQRNEFHLGGDLAATGVVHLGDRAGAANHHVVEGFGDVGIPMAPITVEPGEHVAAGLPDVAASLDPRCAQARESLADIRVPRARWCHRRAARARRPRAPPPAWARGCRGVHRRRRGAMRGTPRRSRSDSGGRWARSWSLLGLRTGRGERRRVLPEAWAALPTPV